MQPLFISLTGKEVVIAGGGKMAARKAKALKADMPKITFIAPSFCDEVLDLAAEKGYQLIERKANLADFETAFLVILATSDRETNRKFASVLSRKQLVCVVDNAEEGNVTFPAAVQRGQLQIAVTTNGASPKLARKLKHELELQFDESWETYLAFLSHCRNKIKKANVSAEQKNKWLNEILDDQFRSNQQAQKEMLQRMDVLLSEG